MKKQFFFLLLSFIFLFECSGQILTSKEKFTLKDSLRGSLSPERENFNVLHYELTVKVDPDKRFISGNNNITFQVLDSLPIMQLDLYKNMKVDSIIFNNEALDYTRIHDAVFIDFKNQLKVNSRNSVQFYYSGKPVVAKNAPWDGGFVFKKDGNDKHWIGVAVQGDGASLWYPNKDHLSDEPDEGADIKVAVPNGLKNVSNGRLIDSTDMGNGYTEWHWRVVNPINNYNITLNIGDYVNFKDTFRDLDLDYYVLRENLSVAKKQFEQVKTMMECFYDKIGEYPFVEDSYKLVETPYLGMEHQSAIAYGNGFKNGYLGTDLSFTGHGLSWDFIIIHESGHEWFGNSISVSDIADLWIHEAFTTYTEAIFIECTKSKEAAAKYLKGLRLTIENQRPMIATYGVNQSGPGDIYFKGANMIHTIRSLVDDDELWWNTLLAFTEEFKHTVTNSDEVIQFFCNKLNTEKLNLEPVFNQYLNFVKIPKLEIRKKGLFNIQARWNVDVDEFSLPIYINYKGKTKKVSITKNWSTIKRSFKKAKDFKIDLVDYYFDVSYIK